jgi:Ca2+-binding RTX toxin-like protein
MEDKLVLGLPHDGKAIVAPANAYRISESNSKARTRYGVLPALMIGAIGAELAGSDEPGEGLQRLAPKPYDDETVGGNPPAPDHVQRIEDVAVFLREVSRDLAEKGGDAVDAARIASVRLRYAASDFQPISHMERLLRAFNDNGRISWDEDGFRFPLRSALLPGRGEFDHGWKGSAFPARPRDDHGDEEAPPERDDKPRLDDGDDDDRDNRLPVAAGRFVLPGTVMNLSALIFLGDLLRLVNDPDGDALSVLGLRASAGDIEAYGPGRWLYTPDRGALGQVTFTYQVSDGLGAITVQATMNIVKPQPEEIRGTSGDDRLLGTPFEDIIDGSGGNDFIYARESDDIVFGGAGDDTLLGGAGNDILYGDAGNDIIFGGTGNDILFGGEGNDQLHGEEGNDSLMGGAGNDRLMGGTGNDRLFGDEGDDILDGEAGNDLVDGGEGNDDLSGGGGDDVVVGGHGDDILRMGVTGEEARQAHPALNDGNDVYLGGEGLDTLDASGAGGAVHVDLADGIVTGDTIGHDQVEGIENVVATEFDDTVTGDAADNVIQAGAGDDVVTGGDGDDVVCAGAGDDLVVILASQSDSNDGDDHYDGGEGIDTIDLSALVEAVVADFEECFAEGAEIGRDRIENFEIIRGGGGNDQLTGGKGNDILHGGAGNDRLKGRDGDDILVGGAGHDDVQGNGGNDTYLVIVRAEEAPISDGDDDFDGGEGIDVYDASATKHGVTIDLYAGRALGAEIGADVLTSVEAGVGGSGDDIIVDGVGVTIMTGGAGNDIFVFSLGSMTGDHRDEIRDFSTGDRVDLSGLGKLVFDGLGIDGEPRAGRITFYHEQFENVEKTVVRAIFDLEHDDEIEILLHGRYHLTHEDFLLAAMEPANLAGSHA